jgi:hypothetical protein
MEYNIRNAFYRHIECRNIEGRNNRKTKSQLSDSAPKRFVHPVIGKCFYCKGYHLKDFFNPTTKRFHPSCDRVKWNNLKKMKPHKTDTCAFTGLPFGDKSEMKPVGDHDHDTLLYRGHIWSAANRLEGALKFIMQETGCSIDEVFEMAKNYLAKPGIDIGLEPYPQLGFATADEAIKHYETTN